MADAQLDAYNNRDIEAFIELFAEDAVLQDLQSGEVTLRGRDAIRALYSARFADNPELRCHVHQRMELGAFAIDRETVTGLPGALELVAIYEVHEGRIRSVKFVRVATGH